VKGRSSSILQRTAGQGLLTSEGERHDKQKRIMMPAFAKPNLDSYAEDVVRYASSMLQHWHDHEVRHLSDDLMALTLRIICKTMLNIDLQDEADRIGVSVEECIQYSADRIFSPIPTPLALPIPSNRRFRAARHTLNEFALGRQNRQSPLLGQLLENACPEREIRDQIVTILIAGHETTANLLTWVFYLLGKHPAAGERLRQELSQTVGERLHYGVVSRLPYTQAVIQETLRLYPPAWAILRENIEPVELSGVKISGHGSYIISPYSIHRDPNVFADPDKFDPERFLLHGQDLPRFAYLPFGAGSRACIGSQFAIMEATLILAAIWSTGDLRLLEENFSAVPEPSLSLRIKGGLQMEWQRRHY
jgi:cytochrome P450